MICHGTPWSAALWTELTVALSERWRVHLWDMPGYGRSSRDPSAALGLRAQASRLADLFAHWAWNGPVCSPMTSAVPSPSARIFVTAPSSRR